MPRQSASSMSANRSSRRSGVRPSQPRAGRFRSPLVQTPAHEPPFGASAPGGTHEPGRFIKAAEARSDAGERFQRLRHIPSEALIEPQRQRVVQQRLGFPVIPAF